MSDVITKTAYPIQKIWVIKSALYGIFAALILLLLNPFLMAIVLISMIVYPVINALRLACFSYSLDEKFLTVKQGIISRQDRHLPYAVIQDVTMQRDLGDRILGLASVSVHNASQAGTAIDQYGNASGRFLGMTVAGRRNRSRIEMIGFRGNMVHIPGLKPSDAQALKLALLAKMKEHEGHDSGSGL